MSDWASPDGTVSLLEGDCLARMAELPDASVDCIVTSPPYWGLRSYSQDGAWGLEPDWREWLRRMLAWGAEAKRVLKPTGTLFLNLGDCYASGKGSCHNPGGGADSLSSHAGLKDAEAYSLNRGNVSDLKRAGFRPKDLMLLPSRVAIAFHDELGFWIRNDVVWAKSNHMPSSVKDRLANGYEHVYFMTKSPRYFFALDRVRQPHKEATARRLAAGAFSEWGDEQAEATSRTTAGLHTQRWNRGCVWGGEESHGGHSGYIGMDGKPLVSPNGANPGDVLRGPTASYKGSHFAVFPEYLVEFCLKAGAPEAVCVTCCKPRMAVTEGTGKGAFNVRVRDVKGERVKGPQWKASDNETEG